MPAYISRCVATFDSLLAVPQRKQLFDEYGIWTQFDTFRGGCASGPSYGHGYALQAMLMMDRLSEAGHALSFLANITYNNGAGWGQVRSPMYFYEQFVAPPVSDMAKLGCGELNIVTVMEPLKIARLILGVSDWVAGNVSLTPRVAPQWYEGNSIAVISAEDWPIVVASGVVVRVGIEVCVPFHVFGVLGVFFDLISPDPPPPFPPPFLLQYRQSSAGSSLSVTVSANAAIPVIYARLFNGTVGDGAESWVWKHAANVTQWRVSTTFG